MAASTKTENESTVVIEEKAPAKATKKAGTTTKKSTTTTKKAASATKKSTTSKTTKKATTAKKSTTSKTAAKKTTTKKAASTTKKAGTTTKKTPTKKADIKIELLENKPLEETKEELIESKPVEEVKEELFSEEKNKDNEEKVVEEKKEPLIKIAPKSDPPRTEDLMMKDDFNHVEVLKKKIQAQKKLNEEVSQNPLKVQISEESEKIAFELDQDNKILEEDNRHLNTEIEKLKLENEDLKKKVEDLVDNVNQKDEKIIVLTNSMVGKSSEAELAKELEVLKKENEALRLELQCKEAEMKEKPEVKEEKNEVKEVPTPKVNTNEKGEIALRIKLLNERIAEKNDKINEVEQELNQLSEKDIVEESFTTKIKEIRRIKKESIKQANFELENLAEQVKSSEEKVLSKKKVYEEKVKELVAFDKSLENKPMNYTDKEEAAKVRTKLTIEKDSLFVDIETNEEYYKKLLTRYENRLTQAEERVKVLEKAENELVEFYLNKLKEAKTRENEDYKSEKLERERLLKELDFLSQKIEDTIVTEEDPLSIDSYDLEKITKDYAKVVGKLNLINQKYEERSKVEKIILKNEQVVKDYYDAFCNRELCLFNIDENTNKISSINKEMENEESTEKKETIKNKIESLNNLIADDKQKVEYYSKIIEDNRENEKVDFYIKLINSMAELKTAEKEFKVKAEKLLEKIKTLESVE